MEIWTAIVNSKWDTRFMRLAREIADWSKDPSSKIGAIIVNDKRRILATGYNGFPEGIEDTEERLNNREEKYPRIIHAETNALLNALKNGVSVEGATLYVCGLPVCPDCTKSIIQAAITLNRTKYNGNANVVALAINVTGDSNGTATGVLS